MSASSEFKGEVAGANQSSNCPASVHCIKNAMDNNPMTKWIANSSANEEIAFEVLTPIYLDAICIKFSEGRIRNVSFYANTLPTESWTYIGKMLLPTSSDYSVRHFIADLIYPRAVRYFKISILDTYAAEMNIGISDIYFRIKGECTDMCNVNAYCDTEGATPTCVCRDGWLGDGVHCYHGAVTTGAVTTGAVTTGAVTTGAVTTGAVTTGAVTTGAVTTGAVTTGAVTTGAVTKGAVTTGAVTTAAMTAADQVEQASPV
ncbi:PREDICTED: uncharacterized protein LOC106816660 [Priapulus caudatus]|uniref:Uncharacterized protein LOC106816660 n=1 Tax=Priapulus caudatus TaxID=37621 RepID=A0ABM1EX48_PRICU|nr:PREDICTED: uncharacterized protein LOC106816660 [Priapulus caudatus]